MEQEIALSISQEIISQINRENGVKLSNQYTIDLSNEILNAAAKKNAQNDFISLLTGGIAWLEASLIDMVGEPSFDTSDDFCLTVAMKIHKKIISLHAL